MKQLLNFVIILFFINFSNCSFQSSIFYRMNKERIGENLIISPLSIFQALSLAANGAKKETLSEMLDVLQYENIDELNKINLQILSIVKDFSTLDIANAVMTRFNPLKEFNIFAEKYLAPIEPLATLMVLLNAVYFKGEWLSKFESFLTKKLPFYNLGNEEINVDTLTQIEHFRYYEDKRCQVIQLPFIKDFMSAIIILPSEGTDINKFINSLAISNEEYNKIIDGLDYVKVHLQLPKFELEFKEKLNEILKDLGMHNAFNPKDADFTGLKEGGEIFIDSEIIKLI